MTGSAAVPPYCRYSRVPENVWPPWNRTVSPGFRTVSLTLPTVSHGVLGDVPLLLSLPAGET